MPIGVGAALASQLCSIVRDQTNEFILARTRLGVWVLLSANTIFAAADWFFAYPNLHVLVATRLALLVPLIALFFVVRSPWARPRAVPVALLLVCLATIQGVALGSLRGNVTTPAVLLIALGAGVSAVFPWGVWVQLAVVGVTALGTAAMIALAPGRLDVALLAYPVIGAGIAFGMSVYAAYVLERYFTVSLERDIERQRAESALRVSEEQLRDQLTQLDALYRTAPIGLALLDTNLRYLRINQTLADMHGVQLGDHRDRTVDEVIPEIADTVEALCRRVIATGEPLLDIEVSGSTGSQPGVTRHWRAGYWPLLDPGGKIFAVSCIVEETTEQKRAQEALRQNEGRLRLVSEATHDAVWDWDLVTDGLWWNEGVHKLFGYAPAQVRPVADWWYDHIHPEEREQVVSGIHALIDSGQQHWSAEYRYQRADGSYVHVFDRGSVIHDATGKAVRMVGAMVDISERKRAEDAIAQLNADLERRVHERTAQLEAANRQLEREIAERRQAADAHRESQKQLQEILDNTTAVIYLKDTQGRYLLINSQYEVLFHVSGEQTRGKTDYDLFPHEVADAVRANDRQVLAAGCALNFEETVPHDDGLHTYVSVKFPLRDAHNLPLGVCGISTDITGRKHMEAELQASQAQLSALIENTTDAIWSVDRQYRLTAFNSVVAQRVRDTFGKVLRLGDGLEGRAPEREGGYWRPFYDRVLGGERLVLEREYTMSGVRRSYLISMTPIIAADAQITGATVFTKDITDLRRAEERARWHQADLTHVLRVSTVGEMAAGLAHEINQPLGAIANYAQGCRRRIAAGGHTDELLPAIDEIAGQALRAGEIIRRLRHLVQKGRTAHEEVDLNTIVTDAAHVIASYARHQGVTLNIDLAAGLPRIEVDEIQIGQVILNLMLNALEAMQTANGELPELSVRTARTGEDTVEVTVRDSGVGLIPEVRENMFERFFTTKPAGLGMGLPISRSIVEEHGGRLWATNNATTGATFYVELPLTARKQELASAARFRQQAARTRP